MAFSMRKLQKKLLKKYCQPFVFHIKGELIKLKHRIKCWPTKNQNNEGMKIYEQLPNFQKFVY